MLAIFNKHSLFLLKFFILYKISFLLVLITLFCDVTMGYTQATSVVVDTIGRDTSSVNAPVLSNELNKKDSTILANIEIAYKRNTFYDLTKKADKPNYSLKAKEKDHDIFLYLATSLLLLFGILRSFFNKYFSDFFSFTFKTTLKKNQIQQQLLQNNLPSLLFNLLFVLSFSFYVLLIITKLYNYDDSSIWTILAYVIAGFLGIYFLKYLLLKFMGWTFKESSTTNAYIFLIFYVNKALGFFLLPFIFILGLANSKYLLSIWILSFVLIGAFIFYRFILTFRLFVQNKKSSVIHFFIYVLALEILPFLLLAKSILNYLK